MKLVHPELERHIVFKENSFTGLIVENKKFFHTLANDLYMQVHGEKGAFILSRSDEPVELSKNMELIYNFMFFEMNTKALSGKLADKAEDIAVNENNYMKTQELISSIGNYFYDIFDELDAELECRKLNISSLIKAVGISVCEDGLSPLEKILGYMELVREFDRDKIFAFVNMRSFFGTDELNRFVDTALSHKFKFFMLDAYESEPLHNEERLLIDNDLCEI